MADGSSDNSLRYVHSLGFPELLHKLGCTLLVTTYQAGKLAMFRAREGRLSMLPRTFERAMGVAASSDRLAIGTQHQVWILENDRDLARTMVPEMGHDACYLPRRSHVTGNIHIHEIAWGANAGTQDGSSPAGLQVEANSVGPSQDPCCGSPELWIVNTLFSCLATLDSRYSFVPRWRPQFISQVTPQDRCHLNGLALEGGRPKYVTAFAETDEPDGWRARKATTGCVIDVESDETIARGLSMAHSPRLHEGKLYVLDSGTGRLVVVDPCTGRLDAVAELPGYTRGLAFSGEHAFVGLSKIRDTTTFGGVPVAERRDELKCGVWVVDLTTGSVVSFLEFQQDVTEIFDVQLLLGVRNPSLIGLKKETIQGAFVLPKKDSA